VELNPNPYFGKEEKEKAAKPMATSVSKPAPVQESKIVKDSPDRRLKPKKQPAKAFQKVLISDRSNAEPNPVSGTGKLQRKNRQRQIQSSF
jgi:hypothetical protein